MLDRDVAPGVHRLEHAHVNCYLVESETGALTVVDAGLPALWPLLGRAIREIGHRPSDVAAVVLTHAHFDHLGVVWRLQARGVPVWVHAADRGLAGHPYRYAHENVRSVYPVRHPRSVPILARMVAAGALRVRGVTGLRSMADGDVLDVPGSPRVLLTPGHTDGHCALHLPDRDAVLTGDALVTLDPYTGQRARGSWPARPRRTRRLRWTLWTSWSRRGQALHFQGTVCPGSKDSVRLSRLLATPGRADHRPEQNKNTRRSITMATGETGFDDVTFDLISVQYHALKAGHDYGQYVRDARNAGQDEIAAFFEQVMAEDSARAKQCHEFLRQLGGTDNTQPQQGPA